MLSAHRLENKGKVLRRSVAKPSISSAAGITDIGSKQCSNAILT
jgi:hypothetical protein